MSIGEWKFGTAWHVFEQTSATTRVYRGTVTAHSAIEAGIQAANRYAGIILVKSSRNGRVVARV